VETYLFIIITAVILVGVGIYVLIRMPKGKKAQMLVAPDLPFELRCAPPDDKAYKVWVRYRVAFTASPDVGARGDRQFGLVFDVNVTAGKRTVMEEPVCLGAMGPKGVKRIVPDEFFTRTRRMRWDYVRSGTFALAEMDEREMGSEIVVKGMIRPDKSTAVDMLKVYVAS
jgi:hypothetical protein